jgi:hypothetical protein
MENIYQDETKANEFDVFRVWRLMTEENLPPEYTCS